jgi:catechol 2,3-dioxygenase-like lactoylglutathione lyase family enzyme
MFENSKAFSGFAAPDIEALEPFYRDKLGISTSVENGLLTLHLEGGERPTLVYPKPDFVPATYTILNFPVEEVEATVDALAAKGVAFERYDGFDQDEKGIDRSGPAGGIAWFTDPAGNVLAVHGQT